MTISEPAALPADTAPLVAALSSRDPMTRKRARQALVAKGTREVTAALAAAISDRRERVRWEAAKALIAVRDPDTAPDLLRALDDASQDIRWLAAKGLIAIGEVGLVSVLQGLTEPGRSLEFYQAAHHVVHDLSRRGHAEILAPVLAALAHSEPMIAAPPAALRALTALPVP
jgi:HEAT repeat protein